MSGDGAGACPRFAKRSQPRAARCHPRRVRTDTASTRGSTLGAVAARIGAEDLEPLAVLADGLEGPLEVLVVGVAFDVEEEEIGGVAVLRPLRVGERLDPGDIHAVLLERDDGLDERAGL